MKDYRQSQPIIGCLFELGMSEREAKVFFALLNKRTATASALQKMSGIPQNKIYETLNSLTRSGYFIERQEGRFRIFEIADPSISLERDFQKLNERYNSAIDQKEEIIKIYNSNERVVEPFEYIEIIHGNENIHRKYIELLNCAKYEVLGFTRPPFASSSSEMRKEQADALDNFKKRGGTCNGVREVNENSLPRMFHNIFDGFQTNDCFRIVPSLPIKMFIFDRKALLIAQKESLTKESELTMTIVKQKAMIDGYSALFDFFWEQGLEYQDWIKDNEQLLQQKLEEFKASN